MRRLPLFIVMLVVILLVSVSSTLVRLYTDWLWFETLGLATLFSKPIITRIGVGGAVALATFVCWFISTRVALSGNRTAPRILIPLQRGQRVVDIGPHLTKLTVIIAAALAALTGLALSGSWDTYLLAINAVPFSIADPVFGRDIAYYVFTLPYIRTLLGLGVWITVVALISAGALYAVRGLLSFLRRSRLRSSVSVSGRPRAHLALLVSVLALLVAAQTWFVGIPSLLFSTTGPVVGASYTNLHATLPFLRIEVILAILVAISALLVVFRMRARMLVGAIILYAAVAITGSIYGIAIQKLVVGPNELVKERPTLERNIAATQHAFGIDAIQQRDFQTESDPSSPSTTLTAANLKDNAGTLRNVRLWDREPLLDTFGQLQEIRTYYDFDYIDNDRYIIDGELRQVLLSPRELNPAALPARSFINERLSFTHGYGLTLGPVNEVTAEGLPLLFIKDLPPASSAGAPEITRPEIYYGEVDPPGDDFIFTNTANAEFDYPSGDENVVATYEGTGGVVVNSILRKALLAWRFGSLKVLLSNDIDATSRAHFVRNIRDRAAHLYPFLEFDADPYLIIGDNGRLTWMLDAYTTMDHYPYAERLPSIFSKFPGDSVSYIRNAAKITIDAYDGSVRAYIADAEDPLIRTWAAIFPDAFLTLEDMPEGLRTHVRYPEDLFTYQSSLYATYHMEDPQAFYNKEDEWRIPAYGKSGDPMHRHLVMKLPGEAEEEYVLMLPFTPRGKQNMAAWLAARSDGENYGELIVYRFPKQRLVYGPQQVVNRIDQDPDISQQISLWDQRGSQVIRGNLLVLPIEESLLYVQPLYIRAEGGRIPELKRVIVAYENKIAMEETFDAALARIFAGASAPRSATPSPNATPTNTDAIRQAQAHYDAALRAQRAGDWTRYGEELDALGDVLDALH
ncbi:MAG: UPF0182 family protein [Candidatus Uhrbacteria bacterium]